MHGCSFQFTSIHFGFSCFFKVIVIIIVIIQNAKAGPANRESFPEIICQMLVLCRRGGVAALICLQLWENKFWRRAKVPKVKNAPCARS